MTKQQLRKQIKFEFSNLDIQKRLEWDTSICKKILNHQFYRETECLFAYFPLKDEVDIREVLYQCLKTGKKLALPRIKNNKQMDFYAVETLNQLKTNNDWQIPEPDRINPLINPKNFERPQLMLIPGRAFSKKRERLGRGMAYYDRFLTLNHGKLFLLGIAYQLQVRESIPVTEQDRKVDALLTEKGFLDK